MPMDGVLENNNVLIMGKVASGYQFSHEVYGEGFYLFYVSAARLSENADILPVTVSERLIDKELLKVGAKINVKGQLRSYNNYTNKKNKLVLTIFAREIEMMDEILEKNPNQIYLNGYVCKKPVFRTTPFGREIADILVAVNRAYNKSDYIPCIAWGRNARFSSNLNVGDNIKIWGRVQSREYQKKNGEEIEKRVAYEVSIARVEFNHAEKKEDTGIG